MQNNIHKKNFQSENKNLFHSLDFISFIRFEAKYANTFSGGHLPPYLSSEKRNRLVSSINILNKQEQHELIFTSIITSN
jgi:hypothetical protein